MPSEHDEREWRIERREGVGPLALVVTSGTYNFSGSVAVVPKARALAAEQERDGLKLRVDALKHTPEWLARERLAEANIELEEARASLRTLCSWIEENVEETDKAVDAVARARAELERERER